MLLAKQKGIHTVGVITKPLSLFFSPTEPRQMLIQRPAVKQKTKHVLTLFKYMN